MADYENGHLNTSIADRKNSLIEQAVKTSGLIFTGSKCISTWINTLNSSEPFLVINFVRESSENEINLSKAEGKNFFQANDGITAWECIAKNTLTVPCFCIWALLMHIWQLHCSVTIHEDTVNKEPQNITIVDTS